jgi:hypothetical protein
MSTTTHTNWRPYNIILMIMIGLFLLVYNRRPLLAYFFPHRNTQTTTITPADKRALLWNYSRIDSALSIVKDGDLIVRSGKDAISNLFKKANTKNKTYSHAGIVFIENGTPIVYNFAATADQPSAPIRRDSLQYFINPNDNLGYAVYRYQVSNSVITKMRDISINYYKEQYTFDPRFDLQTDTALYCTEYIYKLMNAATGNTKFFNTTHAGNFNYVAVDNLFSNNKAKLVCRITYMH